MPQMEINSAVLEHGRIVIEAPIHQAGAWLNSFKPGIYEISPVKEKRSLNANAYCWVLCKQISNALRFLTKEEVYQRAIKAVGVCKEFEPLPIDQAKTLRHAWERLGVGWVTEQVDFHTDGDRVIIRCYYGSSTYNTRQMSHLIDYLVQDAESCGIATLEKQRIDSLLEEWEGAKAE